jgi:hypothetical protein
MTSDIPSAVISIIAIKAMMTTMPSSLQSCGCRDSGSGRHLEPDLLIGTYLLPPRDAPCVNSALTGPRRLSLPVWRRMRTPTFGSEQIGVDDSGCCHPHHGPSVNCPCVSFTSVVVTPPGPSTGKRGAGIGDPVHEHTVTQAPAAFRRSMARPGW